MKTKKSNTYTERWHFTFEPIGFGLYKVTYTSPVTGKEWCAKIDDMTIIDAVKNTDEPKRCDLDYLKARVKRG